MTQNFSQNGFHHHPQKIKIKGNKIILSLKNSKKPPKHIKEKGETHPWNETWVHQRERGRGVRKLCFLRDWGFLCYVINEEERKNWVKEVNIEVLTLGVCCWNLIGQEGNISRVAAGLIAVYKAAQNQKQNLQESAQEKKKKDWIFICGFWLYLKVSNFGLQKGKNLISFYVWFWLCSYGVSKRIMQAGLVFSIFATHAIQIPSPRMISV